MTRLDRIKKTQLIELLKTISNRAPDVLSKRFDEKTELLRLGEAIGGKDIARDIIDTCNTASLVDIVTIALGYLTRVMMMLYLPQWMIDVIDLKAIYHRSTDIDWLVAALEKINIPPDGEKLIAMWPLILLGASNEEAIEAYIMKKTQKPAGIPSNEIADITDTLKESIAKRLEMLEKE